MWVTSVVRPIRFHDLRHTTGSLLAIQGAELHTIQKIMRHKDPRLLSYGLRVGGPDTEAMHRYRGHDWLLLGLELAAHRRVAHLLACALVLLQLVDHMKEEHAVLFADAEHVDDGGHRDAAATSEHHGLAHTVAAGRLLTAAAIIVAAVVIIVVVETAIGTRVRVLVLRAFRGSPPVAAFA